MKTKEVLSSSSGALREAEGSICLIRHKWRFGGLSLTSGERDGDLKEAIRHVIESKHEINGEIYGGYEYGPKLADELDARFFERTGFLIPLFVRFGGNAGRAVIFAYEERQADTEATAEKCRHHWIIESPRGALSEGRCKFCGEKRQFRNSASDYIWDDDGYGHSGSRTLRTAASVDIDFD